MCHKEKLTGHIFEKLLKKVSKLLKSFISKHLGKNL